MRSSSRHLECWVNTTTPRSRQLVKHWSMAKRNTFNENSSARLKRRMQWEAPFKSLAVDDILLPAKREDLNLGNIQNGHEAKLNYPFSYCWYCCSSWVWGRASERSQDLSGQPRDLYLLAYYGTKRGVGDYFSSGFGIYKSLWSEASSFLREGKTPESSACLESMEKKFSQTAASKQRPTWRWERRRIKKEAKDSECARKRVSDRTTSNVQ